ncbi:MAG: arsenate reductase ArsC [Acidobacteriota bacterium]
MTTDETIQVEVLVFDGCPHADAALRLAHAVAERLGPGISVKRIDINVAEQAADLRFLGSPSIRVNRLDIEGKTTTQGHPACRTYEGGTGMPPEWLIEAAVLRALSPRGVLFLCVANSARSQIAEGLARALAPPDVTVWSAGSKPTRVRPEAIVALAEIGIDISHHRAKDVAQIPAAEVDTVITLCGEEECPVFLGRARRLHWGLPDPADVGGSDADRSNAFRRTRDELRRRLAVLFGHDAPDAVVG